MNGVRTANVDSDVEGGVDDDSGDADALDQPVGRDEAGPDESRTDGGV